MANTKKPHWTQTEEGRQRMSQIQKLSRQKIREVKMANKEKKSKEKEKETILVINGWRVILGKNTVTINNG